MLPETHSSTIRRILNLLGVFLIHLPSRPLLYFGNLAVYVPSYVILHTGQQQLTAHQQENELPPLLSNSNYNVINNNNDTQATADDGDFNYYDMSLSTVNNMTDSLGTGHHYGIQKSWFVPVFSTSWMVGTLISGVLAHFIRVRLVIGLGIIFQSGSFFVSYYAINVSESAFFVSLCIFVGLGAGLCEALLLKNYVAVRLNKRTGTVISLVLSSGPLGGVIINQFITWYTNPHNLSPDAKLGDMKIFSQDSIQERIPSMFLILGGTMLGLTVVGYFMLSESERKKTEGEEEQHEVEVNEGPPIDRNDFENCPLEHYDNIPNNNSEPEHFVAQKTTQNSADLYKTCIEESLNGKLFLSIKPDAHYSDSIQTDYDDDMKFDSSIMDRKEPKSSKIGSLLSSSFGNLGKVSLENYSQSQDLSEALYSKENCEDPKIRLSNENVDSSIVIMTPLEMLKSLDFYKIAIVYFFGSSARLFLSVYYKVYGQEWIRDDHFLTNLATAMSFLAIFTTVLWGLVLDRIGLKLCFIVIYTGISTLFILMYFCAQLNKWAYFFVTLSNSSFVNYLYPVFTIALMKWFGKNLFSIKLGVVEVFSMAGYVLATFVIDALMGAYGYLAGFIWTSSVHLIGLIIIIVLYPRF